MQQIFNFILTHWVEWLFLVLSGVISSSYRNISKAIKEDRETNKALYGGVQALLRDRIIHSYNKYMPLGYCPIYAKENIERMYQPYHELGGNDVASKMKNDLLALPTSPKGGTP